MKPRWLKAAAICGLGWALAAATGVSAQRPGPPPNLGRSVHGVVLDARNRPLSGAVVYLANERTRVVHTAITDAQGGYSFHQLAPRVGYQLQAAWRGQKSAARKDSEYEMAQDLRLDLIVPVE